MKYEDYVAAAQEGGQLNEAGKKKEALLIFERLAASDLSDLDRATMAQNAGLLLEGLERTDDALRMYDRADALQRPLCRSTAAEWKAALLHRLGSHDACLRLYRELASAPWATEEEKFRFRHNIAVLSGEE